MDNNQTIKITYIMQDLKHFDTEIEVEMKGSIINFNSKSFVVSVHNGYPIEKVIINNKTFDDFIICAWCDLILIPYDNIFHCDSIAFKQFVKKQLEPEDKYFYNNIKLKYINNIFTPIGDMRCNPIIMYNCFKSDIVLDDCIGAPIYNDKNKLAGIITKIINTNDIYCIPANYILKALVKTNNTKIYSLIEEIDYIEKINNYKIICDKIYCSLHKNYIPVETYVAIHGDVSTYFSIILKNGRCKRVLAFETTNNLINNKLLVNKNIITLTYGLITILHALDEIELLEKINEHNDNIKWKNYIINY